MIHGNQRYRRAKRGKVHIAVVAMVPEQLLAFVGDVRGESRNPIQDGEDREIFL